MHKVYSVDDYINLWRDGLDNLSDPEIVNYFKDAKKKGFPKYLSDDKQHFKGTFEMIIYHETTGQEKHITEGHFNINLNTLEL